MRKKIMLLAVILILASICVPGTFAYFTTEETAHSVITSDAIQVEIEEWQKKDGDAEPVPYSYKHPIKLTPGIPVSKIVTIKNLEAKAYIRANYEFIIMDADGNEMKVPQETLKQMISVDINGNAWTQKADDNKWWYYDASVEEGESTEAMFTKVIFDGPNITNEYQNCTVQVIVNAQAVQKANNGESALEAEGWPEE